MRFVTFLVFAFREEEEVEIPAERLPGSIALTRRRSHYEPRCCRR